MSRIFGKITQNGYVVDNIDEAMKHWTEVLGIGPFFIYRGLQFKKYVYDGIESSPIIDVALANSGDLQIELIQQTNGERSFYKDFIDKFGPGLQHVAVWVSDYDRQIAQTTERGLAPLSYGIASSGLRFSFYGPLSGAGDVMEVFECPPAMMERFLSIRTAAAEWDGNDPIR